MPSSDRIKREADRILKIIQKTKFGDGLRLLAMQLREPTTGHLKDVLNYLPDPVVDALEDHADTYGLTDVQVIELAIANLLNLDATSLGEVEKLETLAQLKERVAILEAQLKAAQAQGFLLNYPDLTSSLTLDKFPSANSDD